MTTVLWHLISQYGYLAVIVGCFFEGEAAVLLGVLAAHNGLLSVEYVWLSAILGTVLGDNIWFHAGHKMGRAALARRPRWWLKAARVEDLLRHYGALVMIGFRYLYALRSITPFALGTLGVSPVRFLAYDIIGTLIWSVIVTFIAVRLAGVIMLAMGHIRHVEQALGGMAIAAILVVAVIFFWRWHRSGKRH